MLKELVIIALLVSVAYFGYQAMQPAETCGLNVTKPAEAANSSSAFGGGIMPKIDMSCKVVV